MINSKSLFVKSTRQEKLKTKTSFVIPLCETLDFLEFFKESIKEVSLNDLSKKFVERFENDQEIRDFIENGELFPNESICFNSFLINAQKICRDLCIDSITTQGQNLIKFLSFFFKFGSLKCFYSEIRIFWSSDFKYFKSIRIRPQGIVVDTEVSSFDVMITYDRNKPNLFYSAIVNDVYRDFTKKKFNKKIDTPVTQNEEIKNENFFDCISVSALSVILFFVLSLIIFMASSSF